MTARNGKPCKKCGTSKWYKSGKCVQCKLESDRRYREDNMDKIVKRNRAWQKKNPDKVRQYQKKWNDANPEKLKEYDRRWAKKNQESIARKNRRWKRANPNYEKEWMEKNPDKVKARSQRRRARMNRADGSFTAKEWEKLCAKYNNTCCFPGCNRTDLQPDHIIPLSKGGSNYISNIQPLCEHHNKSKGIKTKDYRVKGQSFSGSKKDYSKEAGSMGQPAVAGSKLAATIKAQHRQMVQMSLFGG